MTEVMVTEVMVATWAAMWVRGEPAVTWPPHHAGAAAAAQLHDPSAVAASALPWTTAATRRALRAAAT